MRTALGALVLAAATLAAPLPTATSAPAAGADRVLGADSTARVVTLRDQVIQIVNAKRHAHRCGPLHQNGALSRAAQKHTVAMAGTDADGTLSHQLPGESPFDVRISNEGYRWTLVGENVAYGSTTAAAVMRQWMHSAPHRRNILNCRFKDIGVGFARSSDSTAYWTQDFGRR